MPAQRGGRGASAGRDAAPSASAITSAWRVAASSALIRVGSIGGSLVVGCVAIDAPATSRRHPCRPRVHHVETTDVTTARANTAGGRQDERVTQEAARISEREAEVLAALGEHLSNQQIASRLHVSVRTVETHVSSLLRKLGATDRQALASLAPGVHSAQAMGGTATVRGLPATWTPFVGRQPEREELVEALGTSRLVTLLGPGGVGKTRLAAEVGRQLAPTMPLGVMFVELVSTRPGFLLQTVAAALGVTERPDLPLPDAVLAQLRPGRSLLVLDNCEHLIDDTAEFVSALLAEDTDLRVLTTSRARIGVAGERVYPLFGLSLVGSSAGDPSGSDAVSPSCSSTGPACWTRISTPIRWWCGSCARSWTACRWRSSSRPPAAPHWVSPVCEPGCPTGSGCSPAGRAATSGIARCAPCSTGATICSMRRSRRPCGAWADLPETSICPLPRPSPGCRRRSLPTWSDDWRTRA